MNWNNSINRVELQGRIGTVRISNCAGNLVANFSLMTEHTLKTADDKVAVETTWHNVAAYKGEGIILDGLTRGVTVHLEGRLRNNRYTAADGTERIFTEVIASSLRIVQ